MPRLALLALAAAAAAAAAPSATVTAPPDYPAAARALDGDIAHAYAYLDKLPDGRLPHSAKLDDARVAVRDRATLLRYAEARITSLADHHAITGSSFADSWAVVPSYADLWIVRRGEGYFVDAVREASPSAERGIVPGDRLIAVSGIPIDQAIERFWAELGLTVTPRRAAYAVRVLAAGRRDRDRLLTLVDRRGTTRTLTLPSLYRVDAPSPPPISVQSLPRCVVLRVNNSLGENATIAAFDAAMQALPPGARLVIDLRDTPSGGNTTVARAILGWFVDRPRSYQVHNRQVEERETGIPRQWVEQVLPRAGKHRLRLPTVWAGRWTGSMGEGLAIGLSALGADVRGTPMAGLNGAVEDLPISTTSLTVKLPTERLLTVAGRPREDFVPTARPLRCPG